MGKRVLEWLPRLGKQSVGHPPARSKDDLRNTAGKCWMWQAMTYILAVVCRLMMMMSVIFYLQICRFLMMMMYIIFYLQICRFCQLWQTSSWRHQVSFLIYFDQFWRKFKETRLSKTIILLKTDLLLPDPPFIQGTSIHFVNKNWGLACLQ